MGNPHPRAHLPPAVHHALERGVSLPEATWHNLVAHDTSSWSRYTPPRGAFCTAQPRAHGTALVAYATRRATAASAVEEPQLLSARREPLSCVRSCTHIRHCFLRELPPSAASVASVCVMVTLRNITRVNRKHQHSNGTDSCNREFTIPSVSGGGVASFSRCIALTHFFPMLPSPAPANVAYSYLARPQPPPPALQPL